MTASLTIFLCPHGGGTRVAPSDDLQTLPARIASSHSISLAVLCLFWICHQKYAC
jgi:hypothetical protein